MKKIICTLAIVLFGLLTVKGQTVEFNHDEEPKAATKITNLVVDETVYDVLFPQMVTAGGVYGDYPGTLTFDTPEEATAAQAAVMEALNNAEATSVGETTGPVSVYFAIGYKIYEILQIESIDTWRAWYDTENNWFEDGFNTYTYNADEKSYASFTAVEATGLEEPASKLNFTIYPNPATDYIRLVTDANIKSITLIDAVGNTIIKQEVTDYDLDISGISSGVYFLKLIDESGNVNVQKLIIQ